MDQRSRFDYRVVDDVYMLALGNAWNAVNAFGRVGSRIRCRRLRYAKEALPDSLLDTGTEDFEFNRTFRLRSMRWILDLQSTPSITGVPDDLM